MLSRVFSKTAAATRRTRVATTTQKRSVLSLPKLPFRSEGGVPGFLSADALDVNYNKFHFQWVKRTNELIHDTKYQNEPLETIIAMTARNSNEIALHQNASMVWNHNFFWQCLTAEPVEPTDELLDIFDLHFNGIDKFMSKFTIHANALFGSGHTWLVDNDGQLEIVNTFNGQTMVGKPRITPLLVLNVWEHAYVIDYNERKREYIDRFFSRVNWQFVEDQLKNIDRSKRN